MQLLRKENELEAFHFYIFDPFCLRLATNKLESSKAASTAARAAEEARKKRGRKKQRCPGQSEWTVGWHASLALPTRSTQAPLGAENARGRGRKEKKKQSKGKKPTRGSPPLVHEPIRRTGQGPCTFSKFGQARRPGQSLRVTRNRFLGLSEVRLLGVSLNCSQCFEKSIVFRIASHDGFIWRSIMI